VTTREDSKFSPRGGAEERTYRRAKSWSQHATDSALGSPVALCLLSRSTSLSPPQSSAAVLLPPAGQFGCKVSLPASQAGRELGGETGGMEPLVRRPQNQAWLVDEKMVQPVINQFNCPSRAADSIIVSRACEERKRRRRPADNIGQMERD
jgi:hypothetical protein